MQAQWSVYKSSQQHQQQNFLRFQASLHLQFGSPLNEMREKLKQSKKKVWPCSTCILHFFLKEKTNQLLLFRSDEDSEASAEQSPDEEGLSEEDSGDWRPQRTWFNKAASRRSSFKGGRRSRSSRLDDDFGKCFKLCVFTQCLFLLLLWDFNNTDVWGLDCVCWYVCACVCVHLCMRERFENYRIKCFLQ